MREMTLRRGLAVGASALAGTLALSSVAFACGTWRGKFTVTGIGGTISEGVGINGTGSQGMDYCAAAGFQLNSAQIRGVTTATAVPAADLGIFTVTVASATVCTAGTPAVNQLPDGTYTINYVPRRGLREPGGFQDCMNAAITGGGSSTSGIGIPVGTISVSGGAAGPKQFRAESPPDAGGSLVCISSPTGGNNNQVAVQFVI